MRDRVVHKDYKKAFKTLLIIFIVFAIFTAVAIPLSLRTQIRDKIAIEQTYGDLERDHHDDGKDSHPQTDAVIPRVTPLAAWNYILIGVIGAMWCVFIVYYWLLVIAWLYKNSLYEDMNCSLWAILGIFFNIFAVMAFLIVRDSPSRRPRV